MVFVNSIIEWRNEKLEITSIERILYMNTFSDDVWVINTIKNQLPICRNYSELNEALKTPFAKLLEIDPHQKYLNVSDKFIQKHSKERDKAWDLISGLVTQEPEIYLEAYRGQLIREVCERTGVHKKVIYKYLKKYWSRGKTINALLPDFVNCGTPKNKKNSSCFKKLGRRSLASKEDSDLIGVNVTEEDKENIKYAMKHWYNVSSENSFVFAYEKMKRIFYNIGVIEEGGILIPIAPPDETVMTLDQFKYWGKKERDGDLKESLIKRHGKTNYELKCRPSTGNSTERAQSPGSVFEIDSSPFITYAVNFFDRSKIVGRPQVFLCKDVFSRMVVGVHVAIDGPNWEGAMMAIENTGIDKVEYCRNLGIEISEDDWPCHHLPFSILADRGEMESYFADHLPLSLGIKIDNAPPYRGDIKPFVEKQFDLLEKKLKSRLPGVIKKERQQGEPDCRLEARLTLEAIEKCIVLAILEYNHTEIADYPFEADMTVDHVPPIPIELWNWGILNRKGSLHEKSRDLLRQGLLPRGEASVTHEGIYFESLYYSCEQAVQEQWYVKARKYGRFHVPILYDRRNRSHIYIQTKDGGLIKCHLLSYYARFEGLSFKEVKSQLDDEKISSKKRATGQSQRRFITDTAIDDIVRDETEKTKTALDPKQSKASRLAAIPQNKRDEIQRRMYEQSWEFEESDNDKIERGSNVVNLPLNKDAEIDPILKMLIEQQKSRDIE